MDEFGLDIHRKCRREREELGEKLEAARARTVEANREAELFDDDARRAERRIAELEAKGVKDEAWIQELHALITNVRPVVVAAKAWRHARHAFENCGDATNAEAIRRFADNSAARIALFAAVDAYTAGQSDPRRVVSGQTSGEDGADGGAIAHVAPTNSQAWEEGTPVCTCPEVWAGIRRTGGRNLSPNCPRHGEGTQWWRDFWAAQAALGSPRERAEKLAADRRAADSRAGQAGEEVAG